VQVLLINPWVTDFWEQGFWTKPIGLLYVASFLAERGHNVRLIDCMDPFQDSKEWDLLLPGSTSEVPWKIRYDVIEKPTSLSSFDFSFRRHGIQDDMFRSLALHGPKPDVVLVTSVMTYWYHGAFEAISLVRELFPDVPVLLGGIYAQLCTEHARRHSGADAVVTSSLPSEIVDAVEAIAGQEGRGPVVSDRFNEWPDPLWSLYDELPIAVTMTSIGCPMRCTMCASHLLTNGYGRRPPSEAAASILRLADRGVREIGFLDDALLIEAERYAMPMFEQLADAGAPVSMHTPNSVHVARITPDLAHVMYEAGVTMLVLSLETVSKERMSSFSQKTNMEQFEGAVGMLLDAGYDPSQIRTFILFGLPGQTIDEALDTRAFVERLGVVPRVLSFSPVPRTTEFDRAVESGLIEADSDPVLQNNKVQAIHLFHTHPGERDKFRELFGIA
jgi:radical SAM superfamily enzyme YgiQ (UPF0313 family)